MFTIRDMKPLLRISWTLRTWTINAAVALMIWPGSTYAGQDASQQLSIEPETPSMQNQRQASSDTRIVQAEKKTIKIIPDVEVIDQEGKKLHFYSDLVKDKTVIVSFFYTSCISVCPMQGEHLAGLQELLGVRLGKEVNIISITNDPQTDTPERLKDWAARFKAKAGWTIVTGGTGEIDQLAKAFTTVRSGKEMHSPIVYVGNDKKGVWVNAYGLISKSRWAELLAEVSR